MKLIKTFVLSMAALLCTLFVASDYFSPRFPYTHDGENHLARFANYKIALREGQLPPRFAPNLMNHYGYPVLNYNYPLANILSLPFSFIGINYELTFKVLVVAFVFSGLLGSALWLHKLRFTVGSCVVAMVALAFSPYILNALMFRGSIGEIMAFGLIPWLLWGIETQLEEDRGISVVSWIRHSFFMIGVWTGFLLAHNVMALFGVPLVFLYAAWRFFGKEWKHHWVRFGVVVLLSILLSLWFWLPAVAEKSLIVVDSAALSNQYARHFVTISDLFSAPLGFGFSQPGSIDSLSFALGMVQVIAIVSTLLLLTRIGLTRKTIPYSHPLFLLSVITVVCVVLQLAQSEFLWKLLPLVKFIQFPWRLGFFIAVCATPLLAFSWHSFNKLGKIVVSVVLLFQIIGGMRAKPVDFFHKTVVDYDAYSQSTTTANENTPKEFTYVEIGDWGPSPRLVSGTGEFRILRWSGSDRLYRAFIWEPAVIAEPTMNFAGWETVVRSEQNQSETRLTYFNDDAVQGRLAYKLEPGEYVIHSKFTQHTLPRAIGNTVSVVAAVLICSIWCGKKWRLLQFFVSWKTVLLLTAGLAPLFASYHPQFPYTDTMLGDSGLPRWLYSWANFDGVHYITIADHGYLGTGLIQAFFPVFPALVAGATAILNKTIFAGLIVSTLCSFFLIHAWYTLLSLEFNKRHALIGVAALFLFPTAFYFQALYSESLFILAVVCSFYLARKQKWLAAGLVAAIASASRIVGVLLVPALAMELWIQRKENPKMSLKLPLIAISLGVLGLGAYMIYLHQVFGDPLYFIHVQSEFGSGRQETLIPYPQVVWRYLKILATYRPINLQYYAFVQEFVVSTLGLLGIVWSWFKVRRSYVVFSLLAFLVPTLTGTFSSMPRYILASISFFILLTYYLARHRSLRWIYFTVSTLLLLFNTILFIQGYWIA